MTEPVSALYKGLVFHRRMKPRRHALRYRMFWLLLDLDEIDAITKTVRFFSRNRFNLFSFFDADHLDGTATPLRGQIEHHLERAGLPLKGGAIRLATMPRILGHVFNPLSVYYCHAPDGSLMAMLYEVHNTFGQRHSYLIPVADGASEPLSQRCSKNFYVSPFMDMALTYDFTVTLPSSSLAVSILASDADGPLLATGFSGKRMAITNKVLVTAFLSHPFLTVKVVLGIHWEALKIWLKGIKLRPRPPLPNQTVTIVSPSPLEDAS